MRIIMGIVGGIVAAFATIALIELIGHSFYPLPSDVSMGNREEMAALVRGMPPDAQAFVVGAWFIGALIGGAAAHLISGSRWTAWAIAAVVALASIVNILMIPHPEWMQVGAVVAPLLGGLVAAHLVRPRRRAETLAPQDGADAGV